MILEPADEGPQNPAAESGQGLNDKGGGLLPRLLGAAKLPCDAAGLALLPSRNSEGVGIQIHRTDGGALSFPRVRLTVEGVVHVSLRDLVGCFHLHRPFVFASRFTWKGEKPGRTRGIPFKENREERSRRRTVPPAVGEAPSGWSERQNVQDGAKR